MTYSIIGSGAIGSALAGHFASKGIEVSLANNRGPSSLKDIVRKLGSKVKAVTVKEAASADIVILAVPFPAVPDAVSSIYPTGEAASSWMLRTPLIFLPSRQRTWAAIQRDRGPCGSRCARREGVHHAHGGGPGGQSRQGACGRRA